MELENAIVENLEFTQTRIAFCTEYIERYKDKNEHVKGLNDRGDVLERLHNIDMD